MCAMPTEDATAEVSADETVAETGERDQFSGNLGFILAAVGSAIGLGNIWRFPFITAANGGAAFVLVYLGLLVVMGLPVLLAEIAVGRKAQLNAVGAYRDAGEQGETWKYAGLLGVVAALTVLSFYAVVAGWTIQYVLGSVTGAYFGDPGTYLQGILEGPSAILFQLIFMSLTAMVIAAGVSDGIENTVEVLMPALFLILGGLAIYAFTLDGAGAGYSFFLSPEWGIFTDYGSLPALLVDAAGQAAFTLSLGQAALITYGSYLGKDRDLSGSSLAVVVGNTSASFLAALAVFPMLASFGILGTAGGVETTFQALPAFFASLDLWGRVLGVAFFSVLAMGAFTSAISLLEIPVSYAVDEFGVERWKAAVLIAEAVALFGLLSALDQDFLTMADQIAVNLLIVTGIFLISVYAGWYFPDLKEEVNRGANYVKLGGFAQIMLRYVTPVLLLVLVLFSYYDFACNTVGLC